MLDEFVRLGHLFLETGPPVSLTVPQRRALEVLHECGECAPAHVARRLWPDSWKKLSRQGVRGQWLPGLAGRLLHRLADLGLVTARYPEHECARFRLNERGSRALEATRASEPSPAR